jgi:AraC-like DNA-binding protein
MPGHIFLTQPKDRHHLVERQRGQRHFWLLFKFPSRHDGPVLDLPAKESALLCRRLACIRRRLFPADASLRDLFQELFDLYSEPRDRFRTIELKSLILRILLVILRCAERDDAAQSSVNARIQEAIYAIRENPSEKWSIEELAHRAALSESRFSYLFKHATGLPPHAFMASCRIAEAKRRLGANHDPIAKIASDLGFASPRHLTAQFRQFCGTTPNSFRKAAQGVNGI